MVLKLLVNGLIMANGRNTLPFFIYLTIDERNIINMAVDQSDASLIFVFFGNLYIIYLSITSEKLKIN